MPTPPSLLSAIGAAVLRNVGERVRNQDLMDALPRIVEDVWKFWAEPREEHARIREIEALARASPSEFRNEIPPLVRVLAVDRPERVHQALATYLTLVQEAARQVFDQVSDTRATTIRGGFALHGPDDLLAILPTRVPFFQPGDKPLPGVDWVLTELLGVGGSGEVWKASNPNFRCVTPVALKFCLDPGSGDKAFRHEAAVLSRAMPQGSHPGIVALKNTYLQADPPCLEYEFIDGGDLAQLVTRKRRVGRPGLDALRTARIMHRLARIVGHFHRLDPPIVHRDLKPANILIMRRRGRRIALKIADFGIGGLAARRELDVSRRLHVTSRAQILQTAIRGAHTPLYASPEQVRGNAPDPRDDVHALGVIWYQMLVGDLTLGAPTGLDWPSDLIERGLNDEQIRLVASCFASRPEKRPANASVLAERIRELFPVRAPRPTNQAKPKARRPRTTPPPPARPAAVIVVTPAPALDGLARGPTTPPPSLPPSPPLNKSWAPFSLSPLAQASRPTNRNHTPATPPVSPPMPAAPASGPTEDERVAPRSLYPSRQGVWVWDGPHLKHEGTPKFDPKALRDLVAEMRRTSPLQLTALCDQLEVAVQTRYATKQVVFMLSRWCHGTSPCKALAQTFAAHFFGHVPQPFLSETNSPYPDPTTADAAYDRWRRTICGPLA